jgi:hypothetical protein
MSAYWPGPWSCEDGGPERHQVPHGTSPLGLGTGDTLDVVSRLVPAATMVVTRDPGEVYLLRHTAGDDAVSFVERIDPRTLESVKRSADLAGGPTWPGSVAAHANGSLYVVFGNHAHRLGPDLSVMATATLPRNRPYNGFVVMPDGHLVTKDFAGSRPGTPVAAVERETCELVVLEPEGLQIVDRSTLAEPSIARLSASGDDVYVVGDTSLMRVRWDGRLRRDDAFRIPYRTLDGQTYGWDCVIALGAAWFLDNGEGSERYTGSLRGHGVAQAPLHLVRIDLRTGALSMAEVCTEPGGLIANPPIIDTQRSIAVGYDSGNGVMRAFDIGEHGTLSPRWQRLQDHGGHLLLCPDSGQLVTGDYDHQRAADQVVILDIENGSEISRADTGSPVQSVLFPAPGFERDVYLCTFTTISRLSVVPSLLA